MADKKVFVIGGAGFIGRWLVGKCLAEGCAVTVYDNLVNGRQANLTAFQEKIRFIPADILDHRALHSALREAAADVVYHLAAYAYIPLCSQHPLETLQINVTGTYSVLAASVAAGVPTVVLASSGAIYRSTPEPLDEEREIPAPVDVYGLSKLLMEEVARFYSHSSPLRCVVARLFNTYGPYERNLYLIPHVVDSLRRGPCVDLGNIHTFRDYIYVEDVAAALFRCGAITGPPFCVVNVGAGREFSAEDIVRKVSSLLGQEIEIRIQQDRIRLVDKPHQIADTSKLRRLVGFLPTHSIEDGLRKLLVHEGLLG